MRYSLRIYLFIAKEVDMMIFLEDPNYAADGVLLTKEGRLTRPGRQCRHGFTPNNTCQCYLHPEVDPGIDGCHGRDFAEQAVEKVVTLTSR